MALDGYVFELARLLAGLAVLSSASWDDWRTRRASNNYWVYLSVCGLLILEFESINRGDSPVYRIMLYPIIVFFATIITDGEIFTRALSAKHNAIVVIGMNVLAIAAVAYVWTNTAGAGDPLFMELFSIIIMLLLFRVLYTFGVINGGADAKAMMALALLVPHYPKIGALPLLAMPSALAPMETLFLPSLAILFNSVIAFIFAPILFLCYNAAKRNVEFPQCILGYKMPLDETRGRFVWLMERMDEGERTLFLFGGKRYDLEEELKKLKDDGASDVWVTPKIPFIIPIAGGFAAAFIFGNILFVVMALFIAGMAGIRSG